MRNVLSTVLVAALAQGTDDDWWPVEVQEALHAAGDRIGSWQDALREAPVEHREALAFLIRYMPARDLRELEPAMILDNVALAYEARAAVPWGASLPEDVFLNDVLPYANVNEPRDPWRREFLERFLPLVQDCDGPGEAAQLLNSTIFGELGVRYSTGRRRADQSPRESIEQGKASCTGLSILLADACRAVAVPARLAGIPSWVNKQGNHTWVEVWDRGWHFTGAAEPDPGGLNRTWFQGDAALARRDSREHAIYAASFRETGLTFPLVWASDAAVPAVNVTDRYTGESPAEDGRRLFVRVLDRAHGSRVRAYVQLFEVGEGDARRMVAAGHSGDETADLNDFLTFTVRPDADYRVQVLHDGGKVSATWDRESDGPLTVVLGDTEGVAETTAAVAGEVGADRPAVDPDDAAVPTAALRSALRTELNDFFQASPEEQQVWEFDPAFDAWLARDDAAVRAVAWQAYRDCVIHEALREDFEADRVVWREHVSPYTVREVGERPEGGWPLFIAMHGGGGVPKEVNDQQWEVMQRYYRDHPEVGGYQYLALRAPNDTWNGFYDHYVPPLILNLIHQRVMLADVNPDRVFLMGYSHGGYGAFVIGPKIADRFAAVHASAAAPTDGMTQAENLRNTVFTFMIGENDTAYGRIDRCRQFDAQIAALRGDRADVFPVTMEFEAGRGHGGLPDRDKIAALYATRRAGPPAEVSWVLTDDLLTDHFWVHVPRPRPGMQVHASLHDNRVQLRTVEVPEVVLRLDARRLDLARPLIVEQDGVQREFEVRPGLRVLAATLLARRDPALASSAELRLARE